MSPKNGETLDFTAVETALSAIKSGQFPLDEPSSFNSELLDSAASIITSASENEIDAVTAELKSLARAHYAEKRGRRDLSTAHFVDRFVAAAALHALKLQRQGKGKGGDMRAFLEEMHAVVASIVEMTSEKSQGKGIEIGPYT